MYFVSLVAVFFKFRSEGSWLLRANARPLFWMSGRSVARYNTSLTRGRYNDVVVASSACVSSNLGSVGVTHKPVRTHQCQGSRRLADVLLVHLHKGKVSLVPRSSFGGPFVRGYCTP